MPIGERTAAASSSVRATLRSISRGGAAHHDVARLDVEVDDALGGQVVQRGRDVQRRAAAPARAPGRPCALRCSSSSVGPSRCSSSRCGKRPSGTAPKRAHDDRVREPVEQLRLAREVAQRRSGPRRLVGPQDLGHEHREPVLVPDEQRLVAAPAADPAQHGAARARARRPRRSPQVGRGRRRRPPRAAGSARPSCPSFVVRAERELRAQRADRVVGRAARRGSPSGAPSASTTAAAAAANTRGRVR